MKNNNKLLINQSEAAVLLGVSRATLVAVDNGRHGPVPEPLRRIRVANRWYYSREQLIRFAGGREGGIN